MEASQLFAKWQLSLENLSSQLWAHLRACHERESSLEYRTAKDSVKVSTFVNTNTLISKIEVPFVHTKIGQNTSAQWLDIEVLWVLASVSWVLVYQNVFPNASKSFQMRMNLHLCMMVSSFWLLIAFPTNPHPDMTDNVTQKEVGLRKDKVSG